MTSPGEPRAASGQAGGLRAPCAGVGSGRGDRGEPAWRGAMGARRGLSPGAGRALWVSGSRALALGSGSGSAPLALRRSHPRYR